MQPSGDAAGVLRHDLLEKFSARRDLLAWIFKQMSVRPFQKL
jgi:hypothetical protein